MTQLVFISYRRDDSEKTAKILADNLRRRFGARRVFFDVGGSLELGRSWSPEIDSAIDHARVTLVVIGPDWLRILHERETEGREDVARREVARSLELLATDPRRRVVSVRVEGASLPDPEDLPEDIRGLAALQGTSIRAEPGRPRAMVDDAALEGGEMLDRDIEALARQLPLWSRRRRRTGVTAIAACAAAAVLGIIVLRPSGPPVKLPITLAVTATKGAPVGELTQLAHVVQDEVAARGASTQIGVVGPNGVDRLDPDPSVRTRTLTAITRGGVQGVLAVVESQDPFGLPQTALELYLASTATQLAPEVEGVHTLLAPLPGGVDQPGRWRTVEAAVKERGGGLVDLLQALESFDVGDLEAAETSLAAAAPEADADLAAVIELFAGTIAVRRSEAGDRDVHLAEALRHYDAALQLHPGYERAILGRAQVRFLRATGSECRQDVDVADLQALQTELQPLREHPQEPAADIEYKAALLLGRVRACIGLAVQVGSRADALDELGFVIDAYRSGDHPSLEGTAQLALLSRAYLFLTFGEPQRAVPDLTAAIALTTDATRLCEALKLQKTALGEAGAPSEERATVDEKLQHCPSA